MIANGSTASQAEPDPRIVKDAVGAWVRCHQWITRKEKTEGSKRGYDDLTPDQILALNGVTWADPQNYLMYEREVRHRATQALSRTFGGTRPKHERVG